MEKKRTLRVKIGFADNAFNGFPDDPLFMQNKNILSVLAIAALSLAAPFLSLPAAHAFDDTFNVQLTGTVSYNDPYYGFVFAGRENTAITFNTLIITSETTGQRNLTLGVKFDWMSSWQNATNANPASTYAIGANTYATLSVSVTLPAASFPLYRHDWEVRLWSDQLNMPSAMACPSDNGKAGCLRRTGGNFAIYSIAQSEGLAAREEANNKISALSSYLSQNFLGLSGTPPGWSQAAADTAHASAEITTGNELYSNSDFAGARTHYQNALSLANSASNSLSSSGAGSQNAGFANMLLGGIGYLLAGAGIALAGIGGLVYLNRRSKIPKA